MASGFENDEKYMRLAINEAKDALEENEVPIGAVIVSADRVVGRGHNLVETLMDVTAHAEMQAITAASQTVGGKYLTNCTLYVTVEPCPMCSGAIAWSQIERVVYGTEDPKRGFHLFKPSLMHPKCRIDGGVLENECRELLTAFFENVRK